MYIYTKKVMSERLVNILIFDQMAASEKKNNFLSNRFLLCRNWYYQKSYFSNHCL